MDEYRVKMGDVAPVRIIIAALFYASAFVLLLVAAMSDHDLMAWIGACFVVGQTAELSASRATSYDLNKRYRLLRAAMANDAARRRN